MSFARMTIFAWGILLNCISQQSYAADSKVDAVGSLSNPKMNWSQFRNVHFPKDYEGLARVFKIIPGESILFIRPMGNIANDKGSSECEFLYHNKTYNPTDLDFIDTKDGTIERNGLKEKVYIGREPKLELKRQGESRWLNVGADRTAYVVPFVNPKDPLAQAFVVCKNTRGNLGLPSERAINGALNEMGFSGTIKIDPAKMESPPAPSSNAAK